MAKSKMIRVMLSSRCNDPFPAGPGGRPLSDIRKDLKDEIERQLLFGEKTFEVWINETAPPSKGTWDSTDVCVGAVKDCDVLLALSNGNAGWASAPGDVGICHLELAIALSLAPDKVRLISLGKVPADGSDQGQRNGRFQAYVDGINLFRGGTVANEKQLKRRVQEALLDAVIALAQSGVREASRAKYYTGAALDWARLDLKTRRRTIAGVALRALTERPGASAEGDGAVLLTISGTPLLVAVDSVPDPFSVGPAREMVGQPQLRDHEWAGKLLNGSGGPVHLLACHRTTPETTAAKLLGFADAIIVSTPFGIYIADRIQKVQIICIANCRDETTTRNGIERFLTWLAQSGEDKSLAERALARARIVKAIAEEV